VDATTPNLGLTKPDVGASDDTWGEKLNGNFDIIDSSIGDLDLSGAASNVTVTPGGNISSTTVQAALFELDAEKVAKAGDTMAGHLFLPTSPAAANAVRRDYVDAGIATKAPLATISPLPPSGGIDGDVWYQVIGSSYSTAGEMLGFFLPITKAS